jgi:protein-disulfide isomerase
LWAYVSRSRAAAIGDDGSGLPSEYIAMEGAHTKGSASAPAVLLVFSDFQCPFCGRFARETLSAIEREYVARGELLMAFRHLPLPIHPQAIAAAQSAECAGSQGKFWEMHDELFRRPELTPEQFTAAAQRCGAGPSAFSGLPAAPARRRYRRRRCLE